MKAITRESVAIGHGAAIYLPTLKGLGPITATSTIWCTFQRPGCSNLESTLMNTKRSFPYWRYLHYRTCFSHSWNESPSLV